MRKTTIPAVGVALLLLGGVAVAGAATASASPMPTLTQICAESSSTCEETPWLTAPPEGEGWELIDIRTVIDQEAVPGASEETEWLTEPPSDGRTWTQVGERYVVDVESVPAQGEPTIWVENPDYVPESTTEVFDHWQRYSWRGGPHPSDDAPAWPGPGWQDNTASDPHGVGVEGAYYVSHGGSGKGDWFYLEAVNRTETIPAQGEPLIEVENPDYVPAVEELGHMEYMYAWSVDPIDAVSHVEYRYGRLVTEPIPDDPVEVDVPAAPVKEQPTKPATETTVKEQPAETTTETLAETGAPEHTATLLGAGLLSALGAGLVTVRRVFGGR